MSIPIWGFLTSPIRVSSIDTLPHCQHGGLGAVFDLKLAEQSFEVTLDGFPGHVGNMTNLFVV